jgi:aminopeptidase N
LLTQIREARDFVDQRRLWVRLASAKDNSLAERTLQMVLTDQIPRQLRPQVLQNVANAHPRLAWDFLRENRAAVEALLDPLQRLEFPTGIAGASSDPAIAQELREYARDFPEGAQPTVDAAAAQIELKAQTIRERMPAVESWIRVHPPGRERRS